MAAKKKPVADPLGSTCGVCRWYKPESDEEGYCFSFPPVVTIDQNGDPWSTRPVITPAEPKCMFFQRKLDS